MSTAQSVTLEASSDWPDSVVWGNEDVLSVSGTLADGTELEGAEVIWASSDSTVLSLAPYAGPGPHQLSTVASGLRPGTVVVTATLADPSQLVGDPVIDTVTVLQRWVSIDETGETSCGLGAEGVVYCWGNGAHGTGLGSGTITTTPLPILTSARFIELSDGLCGRTAQSLVYCWTFNSLPDLLKFDDVVFESLSVAPGGVACGLPDDRIGGGLTAAVCWGFNSTGRVGNGSFDVEPEPELVSGGHAFVDIATGSDFTCGVTDGGRAYCWGLNDRGQLGTAEPAPPSTPCCYPTPAAVAIDPSVQLESITVGRSHACALDVDGGVWCWGDNSGGQTGTGASAPARVGGSPPFTSVEAGGRTTCAVTEASVAWCWGANGVGQAGAGPSETRLPGPILGDLSFQSVSPGNSHTCGVTLRGAGYCWGSNAHGALGNGEDIPTTTNDLFIRPTPQRVVEPRR